MENQRDIMLNARNVTKTYQEGDVDHLILENISLSVLKGEQVAIMGPSGSGKTTLLNVLSGLDDVTSGTIIIDRKDLTAMSRHQRTKFRRKHVGFVFQSFNLIQSLTALENVMIPLLMNGHSRSSASKRASELLERINIGHRKNAHPKHLSGGEKQRVAIARALIHRPKIVFADEPTGSLDRATSEEIIALFKELNREFKQTVIMVTHDPMVARSCQRVYYLNGTLKESSTSELETR